MKFLRFKLGLEFGSHFETVVNFGKYYAQYFKYQTSHEISVSSN